MQKILILGAGGFGREVLWIFREDNEVKPQWHVLGFIDEDLSKHGNIVCDVPVLGGFEWFKNNDFSNLSVICGVGESKTKRYFKDKAYELGIPFCKLIHPGIRKSEYVEIADGTIIAAGNIITTQVKIGRHVIVNLNCTIGHDVTIEDYCTIAPGTNLSGYVTIREGAELGTGVIVLPGLTVGKWSFVGAGSVVTRDVPENVVVAGVPAKIVKAKQAR
jgi:sugar O-acyltransferase (sialic acid O-acetyltransferase NeuD family)